MPKEEIPSEQLPKEKMPEGALKSRSSEKLVPRVVSRRAVSPQTCATPQASYHDHYAEDLIHVAVRPLTKLVFLIGDHMKYELSFVSSFQQKD